MRLQTTLIAALFTMVPAAVLGALIAALTGDSPFLFGGDGSAAYWLVFGVTFAAVEFAGTWWGFRLSKTHPK